MLYFSRVVLEPKSEIGFLARGTRWSQEWGIALWFLDDELHRLQIEQRKQERKYFYETIFLSLSLTSWQGYGSFHTPPPPSSGSGGLWLKKREKKS